MTLSSSSLLVQPSADVLSASLVGKRALVIGGSAGVGRETVRALVTRGAHVTAVARHRERLDALANELGGALATVAGDATEGALLDRLLGDRPELIVVTAGMVPPMARISDLDWPTFSAVWNHDVRISFEVTRRVLALPLAPGSTLVLSSSGAAITGSPLSGGYAGAKRMEWLLADYAQKESAARGLGLRVLAVVPRQLVDGTAIATHASTVYAASMGVTAEGYMKRFEVPLDARGVAAAVVMALGGAVPVGVTAVAVSGRGVEPLS